MKVVTIRDVASRADTSVATVSRYINKTGNVTPSLAARVQRAIDELGYRPNIVAQSLNKSASKMVGLMISDIANPFFSAIVRGVEDVFNSHGFTVLLGNTDEDVDKERRYLQDLLARQVDGLLVSAAGSDGSHFEAVERQGAPVVFVNRCPGIVAPDAVITDNALGSRLAVEHLITLGHRRIGAIVGPDDLITGRERLAGYQEALAKHGVPHLPDLVQVGDFHRESGYRLTHRLLTLDEPPTAIFVANNLMTLGALEAVQERGLAVPQDLSLVGFDYSDWMRVVRPRLTTVVQPSYELGRAAARRLLRRHRLLRERGRTVTPRVARLEPKLIIGDSTRPLRPQGHE